MKSTIYVLVDPRKGEEYRYVGKTRTKLAKRLKGHIYDAVKRVKKHTHKLHWLRKLISEGIEPEILLIEITDSVQENKREIYWIAKLREEGHKLTNSTDGGDSVEHTEEVRRKISEANKGENNPNYGKRGKDAPMFGKTHSKELREKMSKAWTGEGNPKYGMGESMKGENNPFYGKHHTEDTKRKISESHIGTPSAMKGRHHSEETKQKLRQIAKLRIKSFPNPMQGKHHSEKTKRKMSEAAKRREATKRSEATKAENSS